MMPPSNMLLIGLVGTVSTIASMAGTYVTSMVIGPEHRMTTLEVKQATHEQQDDQWRADVRDFRMQLDAKLDRMESKIDRISERETRRSSYASQAQPEDPRDHVRGGK